MRRNATAPLIRLARWAEKHNEMQKFNTDLREELGLDEKGRGNTAHYSIRDLFEELVPNGRELVRSFDPRKSGDPSMLMEAGDAVSTSSFANITGQIIYSKVLDSFADPAFLAPGLVETIPTQFNGEKIAGVGRLGDHNETIPEGGDYPNAGLAETWIETPSTTKRGVIVPVTKEAIFFDRTGLVLRQAGEVAYWMAYNKELRLWDAILGGTSLYKRKGASAAATYSDTLEGGGDNVAASNGLVDWTDIETAELLFDGLTDPETGSIISVLPSTIIVPTALKHTARRIVSATEVATVDNQTNAGTNRTVGPNTVSQYEVVSSQFVKNETSSATTWYIGDPKRAFAYMENWPATVTKAPDNSEAEFKADIVARFKVSERGTPAVLEPRYMVKCTA